jgi:hypothetical protein
MCEAQERNLRATFAIEQMMGSWCLDLALLKQILTGTNCTHEGDNSVQPNITATTT